MGYFANGTAGMEYESQYCDKCVHQKPDDGGCAVFMVHLMHNHEECNKPESILHKLIPRTDDGLGNEQCRMYHEIGQDRPEVASGKAMLIPTANEARVGKSAVFTFAVDPEIPENEVHLRRNGKTIGMIVNVK